MKKTLLIILLLIVGCSSPEPIDEDSLIDKGGLKYHPETKELYNGKAIYYGSDLANDVGSYRDGKRDGIWILTDTRGKKAMETTYKDGKKVGYKVFQ